MPVTRWRLAFLLLLPVVLGARHLQIYFEAAEMPHLQGIVAGLEAMAAGNPWPRGPELWRTGLHPTGPLFFWLHRPALLVADPVLGLHLYYALLELLGLGLWLRWTRNIGLGDDLRDLTALLLCLSVDGKLVIAENMTPAIYLAAPLFAAGLRAGAREPARAALLPGVLLGLAVQMHAASLVLLAPLALALAATGSRRLVRGGCLLVGFALPMLLSWPGPPSERPDAIAQAWGAVRAELDLGLLASRLTSLRDPFTWLGLGLVASTVRRGPLPFPARLAALWLLVPYLLLSLALSLMGGRDPDEARYGLLAPARAFLGATAILWLAGGLRRRLPDWGQPLLAGGALRLLLAASAILALGASAHHARTRFLAEAALRPGPEDCCRIWGNCDHSRFLSLALQDILGEARPSAGPRSVVPASWPAAPGQALRVHLPRSDDLEPALRWVWLAWGLAPRGPANEVHLALLPPALVEKRTADGSQAAPARSLLIPARPLELRPEPWPTRFSATVAANPGRPLGRLLLLVSGERGTRRPLDIRLTGFGQGIARPTRRCECLVRDPPKYSAWLLFDAPGPGSPPPSHLTLTLVPDPQSESTFQSIELLYID